MTLGAAFDHVLRTYRADETACVRALLARHMPSGERRERINTRAIELIATMRAADHGLGGIDTLLREFDLSSNEGVVLMCLAEALLRIPDKDTMDRFIGDKLSAADWQQHLDAGNAWFVNAATWMLILTGSVVTPVAADPPSQLSRLLTRLGKPLARRALVRAMRILGGQFILGQSIEEALDEAESEESGRYRYSFDMLGESARCDADARHYFDAYAAAIDAIGRRAAGRDPIRSPGISVKLSALHPRYEHAQRRRVLDELTPRLRELARRASATGIGLTVDAEEADRLTLSLEIFAAVRKDPQLDGWDGLGLAVQAYQKRALHVLDWLEHLARDCRHRIMVRLVKGAYWDTEIKRAQERGLDGYPVYTRKCSTDLSYLTCAARLLDAGSMLYPQLATHNAHTVCAVIELAEQRRDFEFQRLHGMGAALYRQIVDPDAGYGYPCRVYAPVGAHANLLPYLVRRLLENGANTSFVNRIADARRPAHEVIADPWAIVPRLASIPHPQVALPRDLYRPDRAPAVAPDLTDARQLDDTIEGMRAALDRQWFARALIDGTSPCDRPARALIDPSDRRRTVGYVVDATALDVERALDAARDAQPDWDARGPHARAACLDRMATALEAERHIFMALAVREAGKTIPDALAEVREAIDFCRYYAARARTDLATRVLAGPTGEHNELQWHGRGIYACISPWNFPLAIFLGQVSAALVAGNSVIAKPASQTPLIAAVAVERLHRSGVPSAVLQLVPGGGEVGARLVADPRTAGVAFTGSVETALRINRAMAAREGPIGILIAETGGQNAMIVDSTTLPEQVVDDVLTSAFRSAGQRCSALRVLFLQDEIADRTLASLCAAAAELTIGDPFDVATDIGPVIDANAAAALQAHIARMKHAARLLFAADLPSTCAHGTFVAPHVFEIPSIAMLTREVFGPILHVIRYSADRLDAVIDAINATRYGLTVGIHTRIDSKARALQSRLKLGNAYVNRNMIGAAVGVQPFGGEGLSGTGPKAGGPHYLYRFALERTLSINTTATGGNTTLATLRE